MGYVLYRKKAEIGESLLFSVLVDSFQKALLNLNVDSNTDERIEQNSFYKIMILQKNKVIDLKELICK